ncbi:MAG TPA: MraY family glycosyltransferase [Planctomycetota bacterium]|nr:MraY family glycosyltransferase [Planctomycetota bacterium]HRR80674.1 MraY family glycosyltransferase [Planctomycetota bacterium]HRT93262.1 MraY family glycosyltransferase [Planctomycetota bacterium]
MKTYVATVAAAAGLSLAITPLVAWIARRIRLVDRPDPRKVHSGAIPRVGGVAIIVATAAAVLLGMTLTNIIGTALRAAQKGLLVILAFAGLVAVAGLVDDVRGLRARYKLLIQVAAACGVCAFGIRIEAIVVKGVLSLDLGWLSWPLTVLWIVGITNAVNLIDGLDGLCAGICAAACAVIGIFAIHTNQAVMAVLMAALLGSLLGFLYHNFNPAKVFMGDCGTYFLGFVLATASVFCATKASTIVGLALPALALGVPIFDTLFSMLRRFLERRSIFAPDRGHIHHRLIDMGVQHRHVVLILYLVTILAAGMGLFMMLTRDAGQLLVLAGVLVLLLLVFGIAGSVSLSDTMAGIQRKLAISRAIQQGRREFESAELGLRRATTFDEWWQALCAAAAQMQLAALTLTLDNRDGTQRTLTWSQANPQGHPTLKATIPVRHRRSGASLDAQVEAPVNGSLEIAGQTLAYFTRLLDEHNPASLPAPSRPVHAPDPATPDPAPGAAQSHGRR